MSEIIEKLEELAKEILSRVRQQGVDGAQVSVKKEVDIGTRFGENHITQNVHDEKTTFLLRMQMGKKVGIYTGSNPTDDNMDDYISDAILVTKNLGDDPEFPGFLDAQPQYHELGIELKGSDPEDLAAGVNSIVESARVSGEISAVAGNIHHVTSHSVVMNSNDVMGKIENVTITSVINVAAVRGTGEARSTTRIAGRTLDDLLLPQRSEEVARRAQMGLDQKEMEIGRYEAVLGPMAVSALWSFVTMAVSSEMLINHASFLKDKLGEQIFDPRITAEDDCHNPSHVGSRAFDSELVPTEPLVYIEDGVLKEYAYNLRNAKKLGVESNGRNIQMFQGELPAFTSTTMALGDKSEETLISEIDDGIYITNLFYNNFVNAPEGVCTGLTRDGLFHIRGGEIVSSLKNFRWTDSLMSVFQSAEPADNPVQIAGFFGGSMITPSIRVGGFNLSSKGKH